MLDRTADTLRAAPDEDCFAEEAAGALMDELHRGGEARPMYRALRACHGQC